MAHKSSNKIILCDSQLSVLYFNRRIYTLDSGINPPFKQQCLVGLTGWALGKERALHQIDSIDTNLAMNIV